MIKLGAGLSWWAFENSPRHAYLLANGWEETPLRKYVHGEFVSIYMTKTDSAASANFRVVGVSPNRQDDSPRIAGISRPPGGAEDAR